MNIPSGNVLPLRFQFSDRETAKFVRAVVRDYTDTPIAGSPFALSHVANGLFSSNAANMPNVQFVTVQYLIYDDSGFTTLSTDYETVTETIPLATSGGGGSSTLISGGEAFAETEDIESVAETDDELNIAENEDDEEVI